MVNLIPTSNRVSNSAMAFQSLEQKMAMHKNVQWLLPWIICQYALGGECQSKTTQPFVQ